MRFCAGDGIQDIGVDGQDRIWISYFDEGVLGNFGWSTLDADGKTGPAPIGNAGLNCFDKTGAVIWQHDQKDRFIVDCYALNVTERATYFYFYTDFDLGRVSDEFRREYREVDVSGSSSFAVSSDAVLFTGQYDDPPSAVYLLPLERPKPLKPKMKKLVLPDGQEVTGGTLIGRGSSLHLFTESDWYRVSLESL